MANTAAAIVDRVLPDVPVRQYVLSLPYELRRLAAFKADVLTALGRIFVETIFASYRAAAKRTGLKDAQCGAVSFVQRFGSSLNLNVHYHVVVLNGVFTREPEAGGVFHPSPPPTHDELDQIVRRVQKRAQAWLRRHGHLDERPLEDRSNEAPVQTALDACAAIAMARGQTATLSNQGEPENDHQSVPGKTSVAVDRDGFTSTRGFASRLAMTRAGRAMPVRRKAGALARTAPQTSRRASGLPPQVRRTRARQAPGHDADGVHGEAGCPHPATALPARPLRRGAGATQQLAQGRRAQAA